MQEISLPESFNLAEKLDKDKLTEISTECLDNYKRDVESRSEWETMHAQWKKLYYMQDKPLNPPWEGSSSESIPMLAEACGQFHARSYGALFPGRKVLTCIPTGDNSTPDLLDRIKRVSSHMTYQLIDRDKDYVRDKDRLLLSLPLHGSVFTKTYYDMYQKRVRVNNVRASDFVVPYGTGPRNIEDLPRTTELIWLPKHRTNYLYKTGFFNSKPEPAGNTFSIKPVDEVHDNVTGMSNSNSDDYCLLLEQHCYLDLDEDDVEEPYIVTIDYKTEKVVRLTIRYEVDEMGTPTDYKNAINYYTHYTFIDNPDGFYGLGYGILLGPINTSTNKILRQLIDAGTLANVGNLSGIIDSRINLPGGETKLNIGKFIKANSSVDDIRKGIFQPNFPGPAPVLNDVMRSLTLRGDRLAMVTETITGQAERVMQPTTVMALIEQAQTVFSAVYERVIRAWSDELDKVYRLNSIYTDEHEAFISATYGEQPEVIEVSRADYANDMRVMPLADPKQSTKRERLAISDAMMEAGLQCPFIMNEPAALYELFRRRFEDIGVQNLSALMPPIDYAMQKVEEQKQMAAMQAEEQAAAAQKAMMMEMIAKYGSGILEHIIDGVKGYITTQMQTGAQLDVAQLNAVVDMKDIETGAEIAKKAAKNVTTK